MIQALKQLDQILRGEATRLSALRSGVINVPVGPLTAVILGLGMIYGACMGLYAVIDRGGEGAMQLVATMVKVPLLFFLTLLVTFPSLYVFNALVGSRLSIRSVLRLLIASMGVMLTVLASFGTIVAFFSVSTRSYPFMQVLNVIMFGIAGLLGLAFLLQTLHRLTLVQEEGMQPGESSAAEPPPIGEETPPAFSRQSPGALDKTEGRVLSQHVKGVFRVWVVVFAVVGAQMAWVLRPFIGNPEMAFTWFRTRQSNFFEAVWRALTSLTGG